ncbi:putative RNA polymerase ECF-type sigma factor [Kineosphaera limosa NBRC 100340]|uniref:Putative RNA polymerase ECF-type sigma factor n=1 Tax=Kineosphaera limosa NBRC 100340 TaxID=1184609 RepID=K6WV01_9MICO|nr:putative RNA polymerase ECF-type sigma factor [Kineosphaera limosa NBRC 100340]
MTQARLGRTGRGVNGNEEREARYRVVFAHTYPDVLAFAQRRSDPHRAEDVVAEAMLTAWRRIDDLPYDLGEARAWIFGIARNCLLNDDRSRRRQNAVAVRIAAAPRPADEPDAADRAADRVDLSAAWADLSESEQETLALTALDGLDSTQAGAVLGITATAYRLRLSRARRALRRRLEGAATGDAPEPEGVRS